MFFIGFEGVGFEGGFLRERGFKGEEGERGRG